MNLIMIDIDNTELTLFFPDHAGAVFVMFESCFYKLQLIVIDIDKTMRLHYFFLFCLKLEAP